VTTKDQSLAVLTDPTTLARSGNMEILAALERRNELLDQIRDAALKSTWPEHWVDMDGKPWPTAACAETIARRCAVKVHSTSYRREDRRDDEGDFFIYVYTGTVELPGGLDSAEVLGTCSSRDQFLGTPSRDGRMSAINEDDIMKAAYSNMVVNGVMRILGLRGMPWERLKEFGVDQSKVAKVEHQKGGKGGSRKAPHADRELPFGKAKGKKIADPAVTDGDLAYMKDRFEQSANDAEKAKYKDDNLAWVAAITEEQAKRANAKAGVTSTGGAAPADASAPTLFQRILALPEAKGKTEAAVKIAVKNATGKTSSAQLEEADIAKVQEALKKMRRPEDDIDF
jgi:hypothetical protein